MVIEIGIETLAWASAPVNGGLLTQCRVDGRKQGEFADDVARAMMREDEIGNTALAGFLDRMMVEAANRGSAAVIWEKNEKPKCKKHVGVIETAAGPMCAVCGRGVGCWLGPDVSPCDNR